MKTPFILLMLLMTALVTANGQTAKPANRYQSPGASTNYFGTNFVTDPFSPHGREQLAIGIAHNNNVEYQQIEKDLKMCEVNIRRYDSKIALVQLTLKNKTAHNKSVTNETALIQQYEQTRANWQTQSVTLIKKRDAFSASITSQVKTTRKDKPLIPQTAPPH